MAKVGAQRAAELTGKSKSTIQRAMKNGKLSFEVDTNDRRVIDVSELERVFGLLPQESDVTSQKVVEAEIEKATQMLEMERMKMRVRLLEEQLDSSKEMIDDLKEQRDQWQKQAQQTLLTSQHSQKQADELKQELKERERRAQMRRQQMMEKRGMKTAPSMPSNNNNEAAKPAFGIQSLWAKLRGGEQKTDTQEKMSA